MHSWTTFLWLDLSCQEVYFCQDLFKILRRTDQPWEFPFHYAIETFQTNIHFIFHIFFNIIEGNTFFTIETLRKPHVVTIAPAPRCFGFFFWFLPPTFSPKVIDDLSRLLICHVASPYLCNIFMIRFWHSSTSALHIKRTIVIKEQVIDRQPILTKTNRCDALCLLSLLQKMCYQIVIL